MLVLSPWQGTLHGMALNTIHSSYEVAALLDVIEELCGYLRSYTADQEPGEAELEDRARALVARYRPDAADVGA